MHRNFRFGRALAAASICFALAQPALAVDVGGVKLDDTVQLANQALKLNGAGVRYKLIFKVYTIALYLPEKKTQLTDILALPGHVSVDETIIKPVAQTHPWMVHKGPLVAKG